MGYCCYLQSPPSWIQLFLKGHSLHHGTCCPNRSSFSREPFGGLGSQRPGLSLETNTDWWADSIPALLQEGGSRGEDWQVNETKWGSETGGLKGCEKAFDGGWRPVFFLFLGGGWPGVLMSVVFTHTGCRGPRLWPLMRDLDTGSSSIRRGPWEPELLCGNGGNSTHFRQESYLRETLWQSYLYSHFIWWISKKVSLSRLRFQVFQLVTPKAKCTPLNLPVSKN